MTDLTTHWAGLASLIIFIVAYGAVMAEERLGLRKSQPVLVAAGLIWLLIGLIYAMRGDSEAALEAARHTLLEYAELFLFLLVAMTFVNTLTERGVFDALRAWLVGRGLSLRALFWVTGALAFCISPIADNLTTALVMGAVAVALGGSNTTFISLACINVVVAANAGGAFSPFGDITTLMVWQRGHVSFSGFFAIFIPSLVNWLVPAALLSLFTPRERPAALAERPVLESGAISVVLLFLATIAGTVAFHTWLHLPPAVGMMAGLGVLKLYGYVHNLRLVAAAGAKHPVEVAVNEMDNVFADSTLEGEPAPAPGAEDTGLPYSAPTVPPAPATPPKPLDTFAHMEKVEWDTLIFFYGVMMGVGGLGTLGYLAITSQTLYGGVGPTAANVLIGLLSAVIDNVPVMFAVLQMEPQMPLGQWLLVTLTTGVGGSLLSIGSAAGVALMGQARGAYTFLTHLRWSWAIALGYAASIAAHLVLNRHLF